MDGSHARRVVAAEAGVTLSSSSPPPSPKQIETKNMKAAVEAVTEALLEFQRSRAQGMPIGPCGQEAVQHAGMHVGQQASQPQLPFCFDL